jgi:hypothetical protein
MKRAAKINKYLELSEKKSFSYYSFLNEIIKIIFCRFFASSHTKNWVKM